MPVVSCPAVSAAFLPTTLRPASRARRWPGRGLALFSSLTLGLLTGCSGLAKPQISAIQFTTAAGASVSAATQLAVNKQVFLVADVTHDGQLLGVSWTVTCGSAAAAGGTSIDTACGSFTPAETASGPVPQYPSTGIIATYNAPSEVPKGSTVTITAHATALPSVTSSVTLTIVAAQAKAEPGAKRKNPTPKLEAAALLPPLASRTAIRAFLPLM